MDYKPDEPIDNIKKEIPTFITGIAPSQQMIFYGKKLLENGRKLNDYIKDGSDNQKFSMEQPKPNLGKKMDVDVDAMDALIPKVFDKPGGDGDGAEDSASDSDMGEFNNFNSSDNYYLYVINKYKAVQMTLAPYFLDNYDEYQPVRDHKLCLNLNKGIINSIMTNSSLVSDWFYDGTRLITEYLFAEDQETWDKYRIDEIILGGGMQLFIKTLTGASITIFAEPSSTIQDIKTKIQASTGINYIIHSI